MNPVRVLHVVTYMGRGGLETMLMNYYRAVDRTKLQFDFLVHREFQADYDEEILSLGGRIFRLPTLNPFSRSYLCQLDRFFQQHLEYQIVHSHLDCMSSIPLKYAKKHGVPMRIAHAHTSSQTKDKKYILKLLYKRNISKYATQLFACAQAAGEWMFCGHPFQIIRNAIDTQLYRYNHLRSTSVRNQLCISNDALVVGHVGRFDPPKNHDFLIRIFYELQKNSPESTLLLVGTGSLIEATKAQVKELGIGDKVIFTGLRTDVADMMQAMDVFVFPSIYEGLPVTLVEAQAAGLPCVISDQVPKECIITDLVASVCLSDSLSDWVQVILNQTDSHRKSMYTGVCDAGFDIADNAKWLEQFYCSQI